MKFIIKYLPIIFGCHCRADRSFYFKHRKFPICARCTGELLGIILSIFLYKIYSLEILVNIFFILPMLIDGFFQLLTKYESNNIKRVIIGILFGYGFFNLFLNSIFFTISLGKYYARLYK
ncbi:DUF2085 domain-containing protein [Clostridium sp. DSM 100503]|uniref:DUF2085 domain-containing protein n=1 Tax=Clostridium sp. DSM 100503 TaxID=2963282 RepID=UPI00214A1833|nr:DUF2085 domain-containing protein [Clostridium sp. DSM 100503]MCR1952211.1 DUF2085 domain-containing protein [Clostridium sp. DSM 100503]